MPGIWKSSSSAGRPKPGQHPGQSSIRGRISGPIPIPSAGDDDEFPIRSPGSGIAIPASKDDEFPIRKPGSGIATTYPLVEEPQEAHSQLQTHQLQPPSQSGISAASLSGSHTDGAQDSTSNQEAPSQAAPEPPLESRAPSGHYSTRTSPQRTSPQRISPQRTSPQRTSPTVRRTTAVSTLRNSTASEAPTAQSKDGTPKRKQSTLRTALGRLFGRKKKSLDSQGSSHASGRASGTLGSTQHRSDPSALSRDKESEPKRSASLPITEYDRALRSHSIGPDDIMAVNSARNSIQAAGDFGLGHSRKRAVTASGRLFPPSYPPTLRGGRGEVEWAGGLSPRPASTHGRGSRVNPGELDDPDQIGRAITSDSGGGTRRRSRSLSGLKDVLGGRGGANSRQEARRRSDEIRYWRESYDPRLMSPLSSNAPDDMDQDQEHERDGLNTEDRRNDDGSAPDSAVTDKQQQPPKTPPQPFNFGIISKDMVGMKITQAASMDTRLGSLETRMGRLERVVDQLCHAVPGFKTPLVETAAPGPTSDPSSYSAYYTSTAAPPMIPAVYQTMSSDLGILSRRDPNSETGSQHSHLSFGQAPTYIGSLHPPSSSATQTGSLTATAPPEPTFLPGNRPTSNSTVRGATSLPTLNRNSSSYETSDHEDTPTPTQSLLLSQQLDAERLARQSLEAQVAKLSQRLNTLSATMYAMVRSKSQEQLLRPPTPTSEPVQVPRMKVVSTFDRDESDLTMTGDDDDDRRTEDEFVTPGEERSTLGYHPDAGVGYGLYGDDDEVGGGDGEDDSKRKKAARTLSLGQLTLGKKGNQAQQVQV